jgi:ankyrin repeat protein
LKQKKIIFCTYKGVKKSRFNYLEIGKKMDLSYDTVLLILEKTRKCDEVFLRLVCYGLAGLIKPSGWSKYKVRKLFPSSISRLELGLSVGVLKHKLVLSVYIAETSSLETMKYAYETYGNNRTNFWYALTCAVAAGNGNIEMVKYLRANGCQWNREACDRAALQGHLKMLNFLHVNGCNWDDNTFLAALKGGNRNVIEYLVENNCPMTNHTHHRYVHGLVVRHGNIELLEYVMNALNVTNVSTTDVEPCIIAAKHGHREMLQYLIDRDFPWDSRITSVAASNGHFDLVKYILEIPGSHHDSIGLEIVSSNRNEHDKIEMLKYLVEKGIAFDQYYIYKKAASMGCIEVLKYIRSVGCVIGREVYSSAIYAGKLDVIKYLESIDIRNNNDYILAAESGQFEIFKHVYTLGHNDLYLFYRAVHGGNIDIVKFLYSQGCPWDEYACQIAASRGYFDILKYLHENGCLWNDDVTYGAAEKGNLKVLNYAVTHGCGININTCIEAALCKQKFHIIGYLQSLRETLH